MGVALVRFEAMKCSLRRLVCAGAACLAAGLGGAAAQGLLGVASPSVSLRPTVVLSMPLAPGLLYQLQGSADLQWWSDLGAPLRGTGAAWEQSLAVGGLPFFRFKVLDQVPLAWAPETLAGQSLQCNDGLQINRAAFAESAEGTWQVGEVSKACLWTWQRSGPEQGRAELQVADGTREVLLFQYTAPRAGHFTRQRFRGAQLEESSAGSFGPAPAPSAVLAVPTSLAKRTLALGDLPDGSSLTLTSEGGGERYLAGQTSAFTGTWLITGTRTARLVASFGPAHGEDYQFTFTAPQAGRFTRQTFSEGIFRDFDEGTFCLDNPP